MALDADEALSADTISSPSWTAALQAPPGTALRFRWANLLPGCERAWIPPEPIVFGFVDDGREHDGAAIHTPRLPATEEQQSIVFEKNFVLHYQYAAWSRMKSKQRWYQCWERLHHPNKRPIQLYRQYHQMDAIPPEEVHVADPAWFARYERADLNMTNVTEEAWYKWDQEVLDWLIEYGPEHFARLDVWERDFETLAEQLALKPHDASLADPRGVVTKAVHRWLARTQHRAAQGRTRLAQRALIPFGW